MSAVRSAGHAVVVCVLVGIVGVSEPSAQSTLPTPWSALDIGSPSIAGKASYASGMFTIDAGGADIWGTSDQFRFVYQQVSGDVEVTARVDSLIPSDPWAKAGVMVRASLAADAANALSYVSAANGIKFQRRLGSGAVSTSNTSAAGAAPAWVRLVRVGSQLTAYTSSNGSTWTTTGTDTVALGTSAYVGLAVTSHNTALQTTALISQVTVRPLTASTVPAPQQTADFGAPAIAGSATFSAGTYTVKGAGADIWGTSDQFRYVYQAVSGDVDVKVRIASLTNTAAWAKAGLMIRESLTAGSRHAFALVTPQSGYAFQQRIDPNGLSDHTDGGAGAPPGWLRLVRTGDRFEAFRSSNGTTWASMGSDIVPMVDSVYVGLAVTSHNTAAAATAVFDGLSISAATAPLTNSPPTVSLTSPANGTTFTAPATVNLAASAADTNGSVARVEFYAGTTLLTSDTTAPYSFSWGSVPAGTYALKAVAYDSAGASATSPTATITVSAATTSTSGSPSVSLTSPSTGASFTAPATVAIAATASDSNGTIARVDFYNGNTWIDSKTSAPYTTALTSLGTGTYTITAIAIDNQGNRTTSNAAIITVSTSSTTNRPPTVSLTSPANAATFTALASISLAATASDPEGRMARVEFYAGSALLGSDTSSPYSFAWSSVPAGTYALKAIAYDTSGASATSGTVTVTVNGTTTSGPPTKIVFQASADHSTTLVSSYRLEIFASGANPGTATPIATSDLGKPAPATSGDITVDRATFFSGLATGSYLATVSAIGPGGTARSTPPVAFTR